MTDMIILKRIKQLENQNTQLKKLLDSAVQLSAESNDSNRLQQETEHLKQIVAELEEEKSQLQNTLKSTLEDQGISLHALDINRIHDLENENVELRQKLNELIKNKEQEFDEIETLSNESHQLQSILSNLENEKENLVKEIKLIREAKSLSHDLSNTEQENHLLCPHNSTFSTKGEEILDKIENLEELKQKLQHKLEESKSSGLLNVPVENTVLELKISSLEREKNRLLKSLEEYVAYTEEANKLTMCCEEMQVKRLINELEIQKILLMINLKNLIEINKHLEAKYSGNDITVVNELKVNPFVDLTVPEENIATCSISHSQTKIIQEKLENSAKILIENVRKYDHVGEVIANYQISTRQLITPKEIACIMKNEEHETTGSSVIVAEHNGNEESLDAMNDLALSVAETIVEAATSSCEQNEEVKPETKDSTINTKKVYFVEADAVENEEYQAIDQFTLDLPAVAEVDEMEDTASLEHSHLKSELTRLQLEREDLLNKLKLVSPKTSNDNNNNLALSLMVPQEELMIGEPMEQHPFMDDATNQMFAEEDARLEQRIRELEMENERIRNELQLILNQIKKDRIEVNNLQNGSFVDLDVVSDNIGIQNEF